MATDCQRKVSEIRDPERRHAAGPGDRPWAIRRTRGTKKSGTLVFEELGTPSHTEVLDVARRTAERIDRLLRKTGRNLERDGDEPVPELCFDEPGLASVARPNRYRVLELAAPSRLVVDIRHQR